ncbi:alanine/glycine:cation symporter family protein [Anaerotalea alkaliphila]|uniref:Sodium:alanine symporter family protein n=1 Tax=Anaerotalea alkaliphila TaxID=2662126 RepID=A0A7X5KM62_9FIRM|nr:sodium:alanine symporter family protein [Anaerotalea alkaliphila]NDL66629.1 sodium:alanine symporter family protein [Anaerotalea alkaliphila]
MNGFATLIGNLSGWLWGFPLIALLFGTHIFLTFRLGFIQRHMGTGIRLSVQKDPDAVGDVSQFSALATALAATIGTGNIVGVATAISLGGPGAVLWSWLTGVFGISTKYAEALLAVKYRVVTEDGTMAGGCMYIWEHALGRKWVGAVFAVFTGIAAFGIGCMVQANSVSSMVQETFHVERWVTGLVFAFLTAMVILGGIRKIAMVCNFLVPFMAATYAAGCLLLLLLGWSTVGDTILLIVREAFSIRAVGGGLAGAGIMGAMRYGIARGLFSNESGMGSAPIVAAAARTRNPVRQALVSSTGTFWDTVVICALTGIVLVNSGLWKEGLEGASLTRGAFAQLSVAGPFFLTLGLVTFAFSTTLGWSYYGEKAIEYLWGKRAITPYRMTLVLFVFVGSIFSLHLVWDLADIFNGLMAIPNLIAVLLLSPVVVAETRKYMVEGRLDDPGEEPRRV